MKGPRSTVDWPYDRYQRWLKAAASPIMAVVRIWQASQEMSAKRYCYCQATKKNTTWPSTTIQPRLERSLRSNPSNPSMSTKSKPTSSLFSNIVPTIPNRIESYETEPQQQKATHNITPTRRPWKRCIFVKNWIEWLTKKQSSPPTAADNRSSVSKAQSTSRREWWYYYSPLLLLPTSSSDAITGSTLCYDTTPCLKIMPFNSRSTQCQLLPNCTALPTKKRLLEVLPLLMSVRYSHATTLR